jgi:type II secretory pathway component PulF
MGSNEMPLYDYRAQSSTGEPVHGTLSANDEVAARAELETRGLRFVKVVLVSSSRSAGSLAAEELTTLVSAIGSAAASRVPLEVTLAALAEEKNDKRLARVAQELAVQLDSGATVEQALGGLDRQLPGEVVGLLRAGIDSGDLAGTFERFGEQQLARQRIARWIRSAVAYPLIIISIFVPILLFLSIYVIPEFGDLYEEFEFELPPLTEMILRTSAQLPMLIGGLLLFVVGIPIFLRVVGGRWLFHRVRVALPLLGRLWMWSGQREFAALLASFLNLRLPMAAAMAYTGNVISDRNLGRACARASRRLESGQSLSGCLDSSIHFDRSLVALIAWGERHGLLPEALGVATELFDDQIEQQATLIRRLLPPITMVSVATMMFFVLVALMIPLVRLIEGLSR